MITDPLLKLVSAFGEVLVRHRNERHLTVEVLATAAGLYVAEVEGLERGDYGPKLIDVFRLASALGEEPLTFLVDVVAACRADPADTLQQSRPSDFARLFRLGYHHKPGDFRELPTAYHSVAESMHAAAELNAQRLSRGVALLDTITVYVRLDYAILRPDEVNITGRAR